MNDFQCVSFCLLQFVVDNHYIELVGIAQFELSLGNAAFDYLRCIGGTAYQSFAQLFDAGWLDEYREDTVSIIMKRSSILKIPSGSTAVR